MAYDFKEVEKKWGNKFADFAGFKAQDFESKPKKYVLQEFPYPSGSGLHVGHAFSMTGSDIYARYMRMNGFNVMFPMGWDAFGLPTENYAIKMGVKPQSITKENTEKYKEQMKRLGFSFDWDREVDTTDPEYYKWTQWIFTKLFEKGLAHKEEMAINWCPKDKIGLANEEVIDGKCERCGTETERRTISQWVVKITAYAERLLEGLKETNFIDKVKAAQINWIDKKVGAKIRFDIKDSEEKLEVFTTRPDTLEGVTFMVMAPEHRLVGGLLVNEEVKKYVNEAKKKSEMERTELAKEKTGVFSGLYAINPVTGKEVPVWIADYVLVSYGTGAIMAVPSHDERDEAFANKYSLPINHDYVPDMKMIDLIVEKGVGEESVNYHLRDWIFSRQHYWGEPIPMIYCENDGWVAVPEEQLPVRLPEVEKYQPTDTGESPLAGITEWVEIECPKCGGSAKRETDTMPNWAGSDWYFLRYCDPKNEEVLADMEKMKYWLPVDVYMGGDEHNTLHLLYSRFIYQFLWDLGAVPEEYPEPYIKRMSHGVILGADGNRMSKSVGNVIIPDNVADVYGTDVLRTYMMFMGPFDATMAWNERSLVGVKRFLERFQGLVEENIGEYAVTSIEGMRTIHRLVKGVGEDIAEFKYNTAIAKMMEAVNDLTKNKTEIAKAELAMMIKVLAPFAPFATEEMWSSLGEEFSVHVSEWPKFEEKYLVSETVTLSVQINGKLRGTVEVSPEASEEEVRKAAEEQEKVQKYLAEGKVIKVIYVKGKTINFVCTA
ncbi:MAG: class I tRNA ligase family protein [Microgenomates group bacterium]